MNLVGLLVYTLIEAPDHGWDRERSRSASAQALERELQGWSVAAAKLGIHVNTLRYRLARIEQYIGCDLDSMADRADFYLALRTRALAPGHS